MRAWYLHASRRLRRAFVTCPQDGLESLFTLPMQSVRLDFAGFISLWSDGRNAAPVIV